MPRVLTIAGSDSGGGAGIQADLKTFTVLGAYGMSVITALTAQNTIGVQGVCEVSAEFVAAQMDSVLSDIGAQAAKTGMLASSAIVEVVARGIEKYGVPHLVVDPVMVAKSGDRLLREDAVRALRERLIPLASVVTPNTEEAAILTDVDRIDDIDAMKSAAERLVAMGARAALVKGGHLPESGARDDAGVSPVSGQSETSEEPHGRDARATCRDVWFDGSRFEILESPRYPNRHTHGTGCTLSAAMAAFLARGETPLDAARAAKRFISGAIRAAQPLGHGTGPVNHLWGWNEKK
ncbi:bifunctional hydroxymethylpyrimidine kinase/phosphomethylpyrimidine kinase [Candidatus Sumerlaeota bacterium]|nr:bifunctional hydroxymethylpyrimidine kinase/phosphomethylpyrimidine kinase [Candidatus Sumerlaeota bacterium]